MLIGVLALVWQLFVATPSVDFKWIAIYVAVAMAIGFGSGVIVVLVNARPRAADTRPQRTQTVQADAPVEHAVTPSPWALRLALGEDGVFLLPLVYIGISPLTAGVAAVLFGLYHYPAYPPKYCAVKAVFWFIAAMWILPHGIWNCVIGHFVVNVLAFKVIPAWSESSEAKESA